MVFPRIRSIRGIPVGFGLLKKFFFKSVFEFESGFKDFVMEGRFGMLAPAGTPREVVTRLHGLLSAAVRSPDIGERFAQLGYEPSIDTPEQYAAMMRAEYERFGRLIRQLKIVAQ